MSGYKKSYRSSKKLYEIVIILSSLIFLLLAWQSRHLIYKFQNWGYLGIFLINAVSNATVLLPVPVLLTAFFGGAIWNPFLVGLSSGLGSAVGELVGYYLGMGGSRMAMDLDKKYFHWMGRIKKWFKKSGFMTIFIASALPDPMFDAVGIISGTLNYPVWKFFLATALGRILRNTLASLLGSVMIR